MKARSICMMLTLAAGVALSVSTAFAQPGGGGFGFGRGGGFGQADPATLLGQESVQKDLELSGDQKTQVTKLAEDTRNARRELRQSGATPEEMGKKTQEMTAANKKKVAEILQPPQTARLDEITLQYAVFFSAPGALTQDATAEKLSLTAEQKKKLADQGQANGEKIGQIFQDAGGDFQAANEKIGKLREEHKTAALGVLTAEQKEKLEKMQGKKFDVASIQLFGRPRGNQ
jgi:hypothetical protein